MNRTSMAAVAAACLLLAGCGGTVAQEPEAGAERVTERRPVSPDGATLTGPDELVVDLPTCDGDPVVDELEEDDEQVRIQVVTTVVISGDSAACSDALTVTLEDPLDGRTVIDLVSGETVTVLSPLDAAAGPPARAPSSPVEGVAVVDGQLDCLSLERSSSHRTPGDTAEDGEVGARDPETALRDDLLGGSFADDFEFVMRDRDSASLVDGSGREVVVASATERNGAWMVLDVERC